MRNFWKRQNRFINGARGYRRKCFFEDRCSRPKGVVSSKRRTLRDAVEIGHVLLDELLDRFPGLRGKSWVAQGPQQCF